ncbi:MAG: hypothetical protein IJ266_05995 [Elusimicrobiaceae bacterium]|nr:hypothetical protein [Elusimicrobiaceae bacterium]
MQQINGRNLGVVVLAIGLFTAPFLHAWDMKGVMRSLTQEPKRFSSNNADSANSQASTVMDNDYRGRAQELRPDISVPPPPQAAVQQAPSAQIDQLITGLENMAAQAPAGAIDDSIPVESYRPINSAQKVRWLPPPPGFLTGDTFNYLIYREKDPVTPKIKNVLDNIHGNLMLDLTPFTVVVKPSKILVMLFDQKASYMDYTKRPAWSGASSDLQSDTMYVIEKTGFYSLTVHELTHLYFDQYFLPRISPLWLSEGIAVYMQIYASKQKPAYIKRSLNQILKTGQLIPFEEMMSAETLKDYPTQKAEMWYTQAYSLVDYLLNTRSRDEFYKFCTELKNGTPVHQALYRAYGMPFNKVSTLQNVWLHDLQKAYRDGKIITDERVTVGRN